MKLSLLFCASLVVLMPLPVVAQSALINSMHSNIRHPGIAAVQGCTEKGGKVVTNKDGSKTCKDVQDNAATSTGKRPF